MRGPPNFRILRQILSITLGLLVPWAGFGNQAAKDDTPGSASTAAKRYQAVEQEYRTAMEEFSKRYSAAKTDEERQALAKSYPQPQKYSGRFLELAEKFPDDPAALDALVWVVQNARFGPEAEKALATLLAKHLNSEKLGPVCQALQYSPLPNAERTLRQIMEKNPHRDVQGLACFALAQVLRRNSSQESERFLDLTIEKYGEVRTYRDKKLAELAEANLFELRELGIGKVAPDIEGEDVDGQRFKLSDYRGKVVVIDFWGDW
ncbi:MAG: redoxin domain-containing protein [Verrucomicrobia bacterium]|nr:redoxin domain-containing protein [Verrucomicrobiota bacterium]